MLGMWIITLFGQAISGAHFNPAVTIVFMLRKNSNLGSRRLLGIMYIVAQFLGGIIAAIVSNIIDDV
jgi:glycerol uptake facilitator-like aquaporin